MQILKLKTVKYIYTIFILIILCFTYNLSAQKMQTDSINLRKIEESKKSTMLKYFEIAHRYKTKGDLKNLSKYTNLIANIYWESKDYEQAIKFFNQSLDANEKLKNKNGIAGINNCKGIIYADAKQYQKSIDNFEKALAYYKLRRNRKEMISTLVNMSLSYKNMPNINKAIEQAEKAFKISQELNDEENIINCAGLLSSYYKEAKNDEKTIFYFK